MIEFQHVMNHKLPTAALLGLPEAFHVAMASPLSFILINGNLDFTQTAQPLLELFMSTLGVQQNEFEERKVKKV